MTDTQRRTAMKQFVAGWESKGYEKGHGYTFWVEMCWIDSDVRPGLGVRRV